MLCVLLVRFSSIGDILLTTPLVRALAARHPEAKLVYVTKRAMAPLVADNPHLAEVVTLEPGEPIRHLARRLRALAPTHGLDLHGSVRSASLRVLVSCRWSGYCKRKLARALLIATKLDAYRRRAPSPVAERYFEAARRLDTRPDGGPPEFCLGPGATDRAAQWLAVVGLGIGPVGAAFYAWDYGVKRGDIRVLGAASYAAPVLSTLLLVASGFAEPRASLALAAALIAGGGLLAAKDMILKPR